MKLLSILLLSAIFFFSVKPGIDSISLKGSSEQNCCSKKCNTTEKNQKPPVQKKQKEDCSGKPCNPFQVCGCCILHCLSDFPLGLPKTEFILQHRFSYQTAFISYFSQDIWQPPKII